jgi:hypothetical protein
VAEDEGNAYATPLTWPLTCGVGRAPRGIRTPNRQIRSLPLIVRPLVCGPSVLLTSQNLVLPVRLVCCRTPSRTPSTTAFPTVEHQISDLVLQFSRFAVRRFEEDPTSDPTDL